MTTSMAEAHIADEAIAERLVACLPAATFEMETLCRLAGIRTTRTIPTAAVECVTRPRLLLNPDFLERYCARDEHLFLLVMHELYHVILGHTRLYPRLTANQNIAFDAVINAMLAREFIRPEYRGFFEAVNPADSFPGLLLRPPEGWPRAPLYPADIGPAATESVLRRLYPAADPSGFGIKSDAGCPTYDEILELLEGEDGNRAGAPIPVLLGDHSDPAEEQRIIDDPMVGDLVRRIVARWPPPPVPIGGRDDGGAERSWLSAFEPCADAARRAFAQVLRRALGPRPGREVRRRRANVIDESGRGVLPNPRDRLVPARRRLGLAAPLYTQTAPARARVPDTPAMAHVYIDVSGSMRSLLPRLLDLLLPYVATRRARAFQFSTSVAELPLAQLRRGDLTTTCGTAIDPVLGHALADTRCGRILVLTDGYTGQPCSRTIADLAGRRMKVHVVLPSESAYRRDLETIATTMTVLPPLGGESPWRF